METGKFLEKYISLTDEPNSDWELFLKNAVLEDVDFEDLERMLAEVGRRNYPQIPFLLCSQLKDALVIYESEKMGFTFCGDYPAIMISGMTGCGKTSITKAWAKDNNINLIEYDLSRTTDKIYETDEFGVLRSRLVEDELSLAKQLIYSHLKKFEDTERMVLLLDNYHRATEINKNAIDEVVAKHSIVDPLSGDVLNLPNLLFTIAIETT